MTSISNTILIIGATSDIGQAICLQLAVPGNHLILHGRDPIKLQTLSKNLSATPATTSIQIADLEDLPSLSSLCNHLKSEFSEISWIIFSAGYITTLEEQGFISLLEIQKTFSVNVLSAIEITSRLDSTISNQGGVLFISSTAGLWGNNKFPMYSASKAALNNFGKSLAKRWEPNKRSLVVCPGPTNTQMREHIAHDASQHQDASIVGQTVAGMLSDTDTYPSGSIIEIRNGIVKRIIDN
ncbi:MAG: SDR family oxidoreductase [Patescibacteria group bacterium]